PRQRFAIPRGPRTRVGMRALRAAMIARGAAHDAVNPAAQRFSLFNGIQLGVHHEKDFLNQVIHPARLNSEATRRGPHEVEILAVNLFERGNFRRRGRAVRHRGVAPREACRFDGATCHTSTRHAVAVPGVLRQKIHSAPTVSVAATGAVRTTCSDVSSRDSGGGDTLTSRRESWTSPSTAATKPNQGAIKRRDCAPIPTDAQVAVCRPDGSKAWPLPSTERWCTETSAHGANSKSVPKINRQPRAPAVRRVSFTSETSPTWLIVSC